MPFRMNEHNIDLLRVYGNSSMRSVSTMKETACALEFIIDRLEGKYIEGVSRTEYPVEKREM